MTLKGWKTVSKYIFTTILYNFTIVKIRRFIHWFGCACLSYSANYETERERERGGRAHPCL